MTVRERESEIKGENTRSICELLIILGVSIVACCVVHCNAVDFEIERLTCVTIDTIEQQKPPMNAVAYIVSTDFANTVQIHDKENGNDIKVNSLRRPYCRKNPPRTPPNRAPDQCVDKHKWEREKIKIKIIVSVQTAFMLKSVLMSSREKKLSIALFLLDGNNIRRYTASIQSA